MSIQGDSQFHVTITEIPGLVRRCRIAIALKKLPHVCTVAFQVLRGCSVLHVYHRGQQSEVYGIVLSKLEEIAPNLIARS